MGGLPEEKWFVSEDTYEFFASRKAEYGAWLDTYEAWKAANPDLASVLEKAVRKERLSAEEILAMIPEGSGKPEATRASGSNIINNIAEALPTYVSGSADLHGS